MALVDEYSFTACAGRGGDGVVRWRREKFVPKGGPSGGDGGRGGDVFVEGIRDIMRLGRIAHRTSYHAQDGAPGAANAKTGADGSPLVLQLPIGSIITNTETGTQVELLSEGERVLLLAGGEGGYGNEHFKSATNQQPQEATLGKEGEVGTFHVELRLIADVGLIGLPNAGKTSLLNTFTNAGAKVGAYPFTTLDPNLGVYHGYVLADIPGLIEGSASGKGLGHKFLRHIARTNVVLHCISVEGDNIVEQYDTVRHELEAYPVLRDKQEYVLLTKSDTCAPDTIETHKAQLAAARSVSILGTISILNDEEIKIVGDALTRVLERLHSDVA